MISWLQITSGRGPDECCLFIQRVIPIIQKEAKKLGIKTDILEVIENNIPNTYKSALLSLEGETENIVDFKNNWSGTLQWIFPSPFRPKHKRKNWFIGVDFIKPVEDSTFSEKDILIETMRSSGHGGQNVNKVESGVRIKHIPTGITTQAREERSQYLNKKLALSRLDILLKNHNQSQKNSLEQDLWQNHNELERGNPTKVFEGNNLKLIS